MGVPEPDADEAREASVLDSMKNLGAEARTAWTRLRRSSAAVLVAFALAGGCATTEPSPDAAAPEGETASAESAPAAEPPGAEPSPDASPTAERPPTSRDELAERWGIEVVGLRRTAVGYMLDFRYRVLDTDKAAPLFVRADKPVVIHHATGARMQIHNPAKTGPLRPTNAPQAGRIYFMMFANARGVVKAGDLVTIQIGEFSADVVAEE